MRSMHSKRCGHLLALAMLVMSTSAAHADEVQGYGFEAAAQEITQLFWLAETAHVCGWTSAEEALKFKLFAVRFLGAHLSERNRLALVSLVTENGYEDKLRHVAQEGAADNCSSNRWHLGWVSYKTAAEDHASQF